MEFKIKILGGEERQVPQEVENAEEGNSQPHINNQKIENFNFTETAEDLKEDPYTIEELEAAFTGDYKPIAPGVLYLIGMGLLLPLMLILFAAYIGIAGSLAWAIYYCWPGSYFESGSGFDLMKVAYTAGVVVASLVFLFMIKPLFFFRRGGKDIKVDPQEEPLIYEYVNLLCDKINAPRPKEICLSCEANAGASFKNGIFSMFTGDLRLIIGIPLIEGMTMKELTGVLSHEIGHFAQNAGMKLTFIIRVTYYWFASIVFSRDFIDELVFNLRHNNRFSIVRYTFKFIYIFIAIPKGILWLLVMITHYISNFMLRQMEYDADRYEAQACGSEQFESTSLKVLQLGYAYEKSLTGLNTALDTKRVVDDFPGYISASRVTLTKDEKKALMKFMKSDKGRVGDTHPGMNKRIKSALKANEAGIFTLESPARRLFKDLKKIKKEITLGIYERKFGKNWEKNLKCIPSQDLINEMREMGKSWESLDRFFQGVTTFDRLIEFKKNDHAPGGDINSTISAMTSLRKEMNSNIHDLREKMDEYISVLKFKSGCAMARKLIDLNLDYQAALLIGQPVTRTSVNSFNADANQDIKRLEPDLIKHHERAQQRILAAVKLLNNQEFRARMEHGEACLKNLKPILHNIKMFNSIHMPIMNMKNNFISVLVILQTAPRDHAFINGLIKLSDNLRSVLVTQREKMIKIPFPFPHSQGDISLADYAIEEIPHEDDFFEVFSAAENLLDKIQNLYYRTLGQLIVIVEQVEIAAGLGEFPEYILPQESKKGN